MFKKIDGSGEQELEGFSYINKHGDEEAVSFEEDTVYLMYVANSDALSVIYLEDIPKLIKALQAAYDYKRSEKDGYK